MLQIDIHKQKTEHCSRVNKYGKRGSISVDAYINHSRYYHKVTRPSQLRPIFLDSIALWKTVENILYLHVR